jgi:two-component system OmpR family response regulator
MREEKIMIVDDEKDIVDFVRAYLEKEGYPTIEAYDGEAALELWRRYRPSLIVLDILMPNLDGLSFCRLVREESSVPIIVLSAKSEEEDRLLGLELGADDYMVKPFSPRELVARIRALLRRREALTHGTDLVVEGPLSIDMASHRARLWEEELPLTPMELRILATLAAHSGEVLSREELITLSQGESYEGYDRNVDTHVKNIRKKLANCARDWSFIETVYGVGYRFQAKKKAQPGG